MLNDYYSHTKSIVCSLYADDLGTTNPIGKSKGKHTLWLMYFQILNCPPQFRSTTKSIFPLAATLSKFSKSNVFIQDLLKDFLDTVNESHKSPIKLKISGKDMLFSINIACFIGDSLASNSLGGFKEGFSRNVIRCCRRCYCTRNEMEIYTSESQCVCRDEEQHNTQVSDLKRNGISKATKTKWSSRFGVTGNSFF